MNEKEPVIQPGDVPNMGETATLGGYSDLPIKNPPVVKLNQGRNDQKPNQQPQK
ncbi:MAG TPA: hypothetical protein VMW04_00240 [Patescibacteria group bacterium]|nr:hypothetical protein [Patescibacteria group bacterium]